MSGGFSFPPPPPPPPRATAIWDQEDATSSGAFRGRVRSRGSGRGNGQDAGDRGRGRGSGRGVRNANYGAHLGGQGQRGAGPIQSQVVPPYLPPGAYVNPNFHNQHTGLPPKSVVHNDSYVRTQHIAPANDYPSRTPAGHKRKLEALRGPQQDQSFQGPPIAPPVPNFHNTALPHLSNRGKHGHPLATDAAPPVAFGLVPVEKDLHDYSSGASEDEKEVDEEALFAELGDKLTFEHNGTVMVLSTAADIAAWQHERRNNWPTKAKMEQKDAEKRIIGAERRRLLSAAAVLNEPMVGMRERRSTGQAVGKVRAEQTSAEFPNAEPESELLSVRRHLVEQTAKLETLRKKVAYSQARLDEYAAKQTAEDESLAEKLAQPMSLKVQSGEDGSDGAPEVLSESSVVSSDSDEGDGPPEETTSRPHAEASTDMRPPCRYFAASGRCRDGDDCRFRHEQGNHAQRPAMQPRVAPKARLTTLNSQKKGIYQRLAEQEQDEHDRMVLQVVKSLGKAGFFN